MKKIIFLLCLFSLPWLLLSCSGSSEPITGWTIGTATDGSSGIATVKILKTNNGGASWEMQTLPAGCTGLQGNDISAVNHQVAWAAVADPNETGTAGGILYTADGGAIWTLQTLPAGMLTQQIKGVKGLSSAEAWAVSIRGDVIHTTDGGVTWNMVPIKTSSGATINMTQVNRMDAVGQDIWIFDVPGGEWGVIHSTDGGLTWRQEFLPDKRAENTGPLVISAFNNLTAWTAMNMTGHLWWTFNGGSTWHKSNDSLTATADLDDICASGTRVVWIACNGDGRSGGFTARTIVTDGNFQSIVTYHPPYMMEGISPFSDEIAWAVGFRMASVPSDLPAGAIFYTEDGGVSWQQQTLPVDARDVELWKVSFVGARR